MPTTLTIPERRERHCTPCEHLGRLDMTSSFGIAVHVCRHPKVLGIDRLLGQDDLQPQWCPLLQEEYAEKVKAFATSKVFEKL